MYFLIAQSEMLIDLKKKWNVDMPFIFYINFIDTNTVVCLGISMFPLFPN